MDFRGMKLAGNDGSPKNKGVFVIYAASQFYRKLSLKHVCVLSQFLWARSSGIAWVGSWLRVKVLQSNAVQGDALNRGSTGKGSVSTLTQAAGRSHILATMGQEGFRFLLSARGCPPFRGLPLLQGLSRILCPPNLGAP